jgi:hypothetical protein
MNGKSQSNGGKGRQTFRKRESNNEVKDNRRMTKEQIEGEVGQKVVRVRVDRKIHGQSTKRKACGYISR